MNQSKSKQKPEEVSKRVVSSNSPKVHTQAPAPRGGVPLSARSALLKREAIGLPKVVSLPTISSPKTRIRLSAAPTTRIVERRSGGSAVEIIKSSAKKDKKKKKLKSIAKTGMMNPYLETLLDPFNTNGVRIPDEQCYESAIFKITLRESVTVNAQGIAGSLIGFYCTTSTGNPKGSIIPLKYSATPSAADFILGQATVAASTSANLFVEDATNHTDAISYANWNSAADGVPILFDYVRLVSAGLSCHYTGTPLDAKGRVIAVATPKCQFWLEHGANNPIAIDNLLQLPGAIVVPINELKGAISLYKPADYSVYDYIDLQNSLLETPADETPSSLGRSGALCIIVDGCTEGAVLTFTLVAHYEAIPKYNTLNLVETQVSPVDPLELAHSMNVVQQTPSTVGNADAAINASREGGDHQIHIPQTAEQPKQGTTLEKVISGVSSVANVVKKVAPLAMELLAML